MKYNMASPCEHCPFRKDIQGYLRRERVIEIAHSVMRGESFPCHKTTEAIEDEDGDSDMTATDDSEECAGAAIFAAKNGASSQMSRIAERQGMKVAKLNMRAKVCKSVKEMIEVHCGEEEEEGEPCSVCNEDCLAPAGYEMGGGIVEGTETVTTCCDECGDYVCDNCSTVSGGIRTCHNCVEAS